MTLRTEARLEAAARAVRRLPAYRLRALTLWQPMAWAVAARHKPIENRPKPPPRAMIGVPFVVHAGLRWDEGHAAMVRELVGELPPAARIHGAAIAVATIVHVVDETSLDLSEEERRWFFGPFGYVLADVVAIPEPIPCRGFQGFWPLSMDVDHLVRRQLAAATELA